MPDGNYVIQILLNAKDQSVKAVLQDTGGEVKKFASETEDMAGRIKSAFTSAAIAMTFGRAIPIMRESIDAYVKAQNALNGMRAAAEATGTSFDGALTFLKAYTKDGLVPMEDASTSLRNLLQSGYGLPQAIDILARFKDSAAYGRKEQIAMGDAVRFATEALKVGNQRGLDAISITGDMSVAQKQYADGVGTTTAKLTDAEKRQANYDSIMVQTNRTIGNALKLHGEVAGKMAEEAKAANDLKEAIGGALAPAYSALLETMTSALEGMKGFVDVNPQVTATLLGGAGLVAAVAAAAVVFALMGTAGIIAVGILSGLVVGTAGMVGVNAKLAALNDEIERMGDKAPASRKALQELLSSIRTLGVFPGNVPAIDNFFDRLSSGLGMADDAAGDLNQTLGTLQGPPVAPINDLAEAVEGAAVAFEHYNKEGNKDRQVYMGDQVEEWDGTTDAIEETRAEMEAFWKAHGRGAKEAIRDQRTVEKSLQNMFADWGDLGSVVTDVADRTANNIGDTLAAVASANEEAIAEMMANWDSFFQWLWQMIFRTAIKMAILGLVKWVNPAAAVGADIIGDVSGGGWGETGQHGGMVSGGIRGVDSVRIRAMPDEYLASVPLTAKLERMATGWESMMATATMGPAPAFAGGSGQAPALHFHTMDYPSYRRAIRNGELGREVRTAIKYGRFHP